MTHPGGSRRFFVFQGAVRGATPATTFGLTGSLVGVAILALVVGGIAWSALSARPVSASRPHLFGGSLVLGAPARPVVLDVATAQVTVALDGVVGDVGASQSGQVQPVPVSGGTVLVNTVSGNFNFLDADDYVVDPNTSGVGLGTLASSQAAEGFADGPDAYIVRSAANSTVSLVGRSTVAAAAQQASTSGAGAMQVTPIGFAAVGARVGLTPGSAVVAGGDLWLLAAVGGSSCRVERLSPDARSRQGLSVSSAATLSSACDQAALEAIDGEVAVAYPGGVRFVGGHPGAAPAHPSGPVRVLAGATAIVPVTGAVDEAWFLAHEAAGWELAGVESGGKVSGPYRLGGLAPDAVPAVPVLARGELYTLNESAGPRPTLWTIAVAGGHMAPLPGQAVYPAEPNEDETFGGAVVLADGPRVVFNNPISDEAVVVFTDGSRNPAAVDKTSATVVSTTGPADVNPPSTAPSGQAGTSAPSKSPVPVQPIDPQLACAQSSQKPYLPQITAVTPSSSTVLVAWSYQLLAQTDCEPDQWSVQVRALSGNRQPATPVRTVVGQDQYLFSGLIPATSYEVTVTAFINSQSTSSLPATFTTTPRGPDAPLSVTTTADGAGDWIVSWTPCTGAAHPNCVVPADEWTVVGAACGTSGYVGTPPTVQVPGTTDTVKIDAADLDLLGDSLSFDVQGRLASGLAGDPTSDHACTEVWQPPNPADIALSGAGTASSGGTISATLQVEVPAGVAYPFGVPAGQAEFVYSVGGQQVGPTTATSVTVTGLPAGQALTPSVVVYPEGHPAASVTVTGAPFSQTLPWPADLASSKPTVAIPTDGSVGTMTVDFPSDLPDGPLVARDVAAVCGNTSYPLGGGSAAVTAGTLTLPLDPGMGDSCTLSLRLDDTASPDPYGVASPTLTWSFDIAPPPHYSFVYSYVSGPTATDLLAPWTVAVSSDGPALTTGGDWQIVACDSSTCPPGGTSDSTDPCDVTQSLSSPEFPQDVSFPVTCLGDSIDVVFEYMGTQHVVPASETGSTPTPPTTTTTTTPPPTTTPPTSTPPSSDAAGSADLPESRGNHL